MYTQLLVGGAPGLKVVVRFRGTSVDEVRLYMNGEGTDLLYQPYLGILLSWRGATIGSHAHGSFVVITSANSLI